MFRNHDDFVATLARLEQDHSFVCESAWACWNLQRGNNPQETSAKVVSDATCPTFAGEPIQCSLRARTRIRIGQTLEPLYSRADVGEVDKTIRRCRPNVATIKRWCCQCLLEAIYHGADIGEVDVAIRECAGAVPNRAAKHDILEFCARVLATLHGHEPHER